MIDVSTTCAVVIFRVKVSCITSVEGIILWLLIWLVNYVALWLLFLAMKRFVARGSKQPANSGGPYFLGIYLLVSAMTSSRDKLGRNWKIPEEVNVPRELRQTLHFSEILGIHFSWYKLKYIFLDPFQWTHARRNLVRTMVTVCSWKEPRTVTAVSAMVLGTMVLAVIRVSITEAAARWGD